MGPPVANGPRLRSPRYSKSREPPSGAKTRSSKSGAQQPSGTLVRQELARELDLLKGKRLVIWTFAERDLRFGMKGWEKIALEE